MTPSKRIKRSNASSPENQEKEESRFRLLELPPELLVQVVNILDDDRQIGTKFPPNACKELHRLGQTNRMFWSLCRPKIWKNIRYKKSQLPLTANRDLFAFLEVCKQCEQLGIPNPPIQCLSLRGGNHFSTFSEESQFLSRVLLKIQATLRVLWLTKFELQKFIIDDFIKALAACQLNAIRINQVEVLSNTLKWEDVEAIYKDAFKELRTVQILHSSFLWLVLAKFAPNVKSFLWWPSSRIIEDADQVVRKNMATLENISLDVVNHPSYLLGLSGLIKELHTQGTFLPLKELFLESPLPKKNCYDLVYTLKHATQLRRLAWYHVGVTHATPSFFQKIHASCPHLNSLVILAGASGDTSRALSWASPLDEYLPVLARFLNLKLFGWDYMSPRPQGTAGRARQREWEEATLIQMGRGLKNLKTAVAITEDSAEGARGYFAVFDGKGGATLKYKLVKDFLVPYDRWTILD